MLKESDIEVRYFDCNGELLNMKSPEVQKRLEEELFKAMDEIFEEQAKLYT